MSERDDTWGYGIAAHQAALAEAEAERDRLRERVRELEGIEERAEQEADRYELGKSELMLVNAMRTARDRWKERAERAEAKLAKIRALPRFPVSTAHGPERAVYATDLDDALTDPEASDADA